MKRGIVIPIVFTALYFFGGLNGFTQSSSELGGVKQSQIKVRQEVNEFRSLLRPIFNELGQLGATPEDIDIIREALIELQKMDQQEMGAIVSALDDAIQSPALAANSEKMRGVLKRQEVVLKTLQRIFDRLATREQKQKLIARVESLRHRQSLNTHRTENLKNGEGDALLAKLEQRAIEESVHDLARQIEADQENAKQNGRDSSGIDKKTLDSLKAKAEQATQALAEGKYAKAAQAQQQLEEILADVAVEAGEEPVTKELLLDLTDRLKELVARQQALLDGGNELARSYPEQDAIAGETHALIVPVQDLNAAAGYPVRSAADAMRLALAAMNGGDPANFQINAIENLKLAIMRLESQGEKVAEASDASETADQPGAVASEEAADEQNAGSSNEDTAPSSGESSGPEGENAEPSSDPSGEASGESDEAGGENGEPLGEPGDGSSGEPGEPSSAETDGLDGETPEFSKGESDSPEGENAEPSAEQSGEPGGENGEPSDEQKSSQGVESADSSNEQCSGSDCQNAGSPNEPCSDPNCENAGSPSGQSGGSSEESNKGQNGGSGDENSGRSKQQSGGSGGAGAGAGASAGSDSLSALARMYGRANDLRDQQSAQRANRSSAKDQAEIARKTAELQSEVLSESPLAARQLGRAAARMAEMLDPQLGLGERLSKRSEVDTLLSQASETILREGRLQWKEKEGLIPTEIRESTIIVEYTDDDLIEENLFGQPSLSPADRSAIESARDETVSPEYAPLVNSYYEKLSRMQAEDTN